MDQLVARRDDHPPRDLRVRRSNCIWHMRCGLTDQFEIAQSGVVGDAAADKTLLIKSSVYAVTFSAKRIMSSM